MKKTKQQRQLDKLQAAVDGIEASQKAQEQAQCRHSEVDVRVFLHDRDNNEPYHMSVYSPRGKAWVAKLHCAKCGKELTTGKLDVKVGCKEE